MKSLVCGHTPTSKWQRQLNLVLETKTLNHQLLHAIYKLPFTVQKSLLATPNTVTVKYTDGVLKLFDITAPGA